MIEKEATKAPGYTDRTETIRASSAPGASLDTIVAIATANGQAPIAILRISGPEAHATLRAVFHIARPSALANRKLAYGHVQEDGVFRDEAMAVLMRPPHTYTGEPMAELHVHGGAASIQTALRLCLASGARLAEPGEFTKRAFLNGRIDMAQAEAVMSLIRAQTEAQASAALTQLQGGLSEKIRAALDALLMPIAALEAALDYPEEDIPPTELRALAETLRAVRAQLQALLAQRAAGRMLREGFRVVLTGQPNAGKSSLFNTLIGQNRAIVTEFAGTTRDALHECVEVDGLPVWFADTAGLREDATGIEEIGIAVAHEALAAADLVLWVEDGSVPPDPALRTEIEAHTRAPIWHVLNKSDLRAFTPPPPVCEREFVCSAHTGEGLPALRAALRHAALGDVQPHALLLTQQRHIEAVQRADAHLRDALTALEARVSPDCVSIDLRAASQALGEIVGVDADAQLIDTIFSTFCLGK